jgi:hypothetical protein
MEQRHFWEANSSSASQEIPPVLWDMKVHRRIYKSLSRVLILSQFNPVHVSLSLIVFPSMLVSSFNETVAQNVNAM